MGMLDSAAEVVAKAAKSLVPPPDSEHSANYRWRWSIFLVSSSSFIGVCAITVLAFGLTPNVFGGFARASDVQANLAEQRTHWSYDADKNILDLRIKHCNATTPEAKQLYWSKISELLVRYQQLTGHPYTLPQCSDL
jgi:hypothetical protein